MVQKKSIINNTILFKEMTIFVQTKTLRPKNEGTKSLVKIGSVTAEIFPLWANRPWKNAPVTVVICLTLIMASETYLLKFCQNKVSNS